MITHLFFADNALFCFEAHQNSCNTMRYVLDTFCKISGQLVSYEKSNIKFSPNTHNEVRQTLKESLGIQNEKNICNYLGCPIEIDARSNSKFNPIIEKMTKKINFLEIHISYTIRTTFTNNKHHPHSQNIKYNGHIYASKESN